MRNIVKQHNPMNSPIHTNLKKPHLVIIGCGMACGKLLEALIKRDAEHYHISVIGEENTPNYNRIMLSPLLAGEITQEALILNSLAWYEANGITLYSGEKVIHVNTDRKSLTTDVGTELCYDHLVFATGSRPAKIPASGQHLKNIFAFRTLKDVEGILQVAHKAKKALVIGGGLLGLEAAYGLALQGVHTTVIHRSSHLLNRQLDSAAGALLQTSMETLGVNSILNDEVASFEGSEAVKTATLKSGLTLSVDLVIIATGITPETTLARQVSLACNRGIKVDDDLLTSDANISALGECIEHKNTTFGLVAPIWDQVEILADRLIYSRQSPYVQRPSPTKLKVSGIDLFSAGDISEKTDDQVILIQDTASHIYRKFILRNQRLVGIVLFGDVQGGNTYFELLESQQPIPHLLPPLLLGDLTTHSAITEFEHLGSENDLTGATL